VTGVTFFDDGLAALIDIVCFTFFLSLFRCLTLLFLNQLSFWDELLKPSTDLDHLQAIAAQLHVATDEVFDNPFTQYIHTYLSLFSIFAHSILSEFFFVIISLFDCNVFLFVNSFYFNSSFPRHIIIASNFFTPYLTSSLPLPTPSPSPPPPATHQASSAYRRVLQLHSESPQVLRMFASFLVEVANEDAFGAALVDKADRLEDAQSTAHREYGKMRLCGVIW
jgi:hypothetical protein